MGGYIEPSAGKIDPERCIFRGSDPFHELRCRDGGELRRGLGQDHILGPDLGAEIALQLSVLVILGDGENIGFEPKEVLFEVKTMIGALADDDLVNHVECLKNPFFVLVGERRTSLLMCPEHLLGCEGNGEKIPLRLSLAEELHMARMDDVVATGDENVTHPSTMPPGFPLDKESLKKRVASTSFEGFSHGLNLSPSCSCRSSSRRLPPFPHPKPPPINPALPERS